MNLITQIDDVLQALRTPCGGKRSSKECCGICVDGYFADCPEWKSPVMDDGYPSHCYYICKARRLLRKFRKMIKEGVAK